MNINAINYVNQEDAIRKASVNIKSNVSESEDKTAAAAAFESCAVSGLGQVTNTQSAAQSAKALMQEADDVLEQLKQSAETAKGSLDALFKKLSGADCVKLDEEGYGLNDTEPEKIVTVVERIKIMLAAYCEDYQVTGQSIDMDKAEQVTGSVALANAAADRLSGYDVPVTEENLNDMKEAFDKLQNTGDLSENSKLYLVKNQQEPTIENVYNAQHKSAKQEGERKALSEADWNELKPQVEKVIEKAGLEVNEQNLDNARSFMERDIPVTAENLRYKAALDALDMSVFKDILGNADQKIFENLSGSENVDIDEDAKTVMNKIFDAMAAVISEGRSAKEAYVTEKPSEWREVAAAINTSNAADESYVCRVLRSGKDFNLKNLSESIENNSHSESECAEYIKSMTKDELENYRRLEELRILMTADAGLSLVRQGFNLNKEPIIKLVEELKKMELAWAGEPADAVFDVRQAVYEVSKAPDDFIGAMLFESGGRAVITLEMSAQTAFSYKQRYREAGQTYEAVGTQVRRDLGDSVDKAVSSSTADLLESLDLEDNRANRDAIRILGNNQMEITKENVDRVKELYASLQSLIKNMTPDAALSMIRDGINPMKSDINDVNAYLTEMNRNNNNKEEKFSTFLYKLDRTKGITEEERRQFIGIYRMINIFTKDAGKAVGALVRQGADITMSNLMTAYNSKKASGIDRLIDDSVGMAEIEGTVNYYNTLFDTQKDKITPRTLKLVNDEEKIGERSVEGFIEAVDDNYDLNEEAAYYDEYLEALNDIKETDEAVLRELCRFDAGVSVSGIRAMQEIMQSGWNSQALKGLGQPKKERAMQMLDKLDDEEELESIRKELEDGVKDDMDSALNSAESRDDIENLRMRSRVVFMVNDMSRRHDYRIPFENNNEIGTIHLQLVHDEENAGRIAIDVETAEVGRMHIEVRAGVEEISVFAVTDGSGEKLAQKLENAAEAIPNMSFNVSKSDILPQTELPVSADDISTGRLYTIAKNIIKAVIS